jgi:hypothetical protein
MGGWLPYIVACSHSRMEEEEDVVNGFVVVVVVGLVVAAAVSQWLRPTTWGFCS